MIAECASIYIIYDASITLFEKAWTWHEVPVPNHLMETESEFAPWDLSKAHILVSTPANLGALLAQPQTNTDVQCLPLPISMGRLSSANLQKSPLSKTRM